MVVLEGSQVEYTFESSGEYKVTLTVEDAEGNVGATTFTVKVESGPLGWILLILVLVIAGVAVLSLARRRSRGAGE